MAMTPYPGLQSLVRIPEHLSYEEASTLPCAALTAYNALMGPKPVKAGDYVLVLGTGGVSIFGLQLAVASGAIVIATSSSDEKLKLATKLGAKHVINYKTTPAWDDEVLRITGGVGVDHVIEEGLESSIILPIIMKSITLRGIHVGSVQQFENLNRLLIAHPETTRPVINRVFTFEQAKEAYAYLGAQTHSGKLVIKVAA
ncbi:hypothetical protein DXG03_004013 [Asterophora parasitica]|uniref:Enoyl reductase (ER) domain-containing protein n=1 Tax=Asterophora parasitica TaxID=117018 RepID=A0A9P7G1G7_9AGAR|nr:hypothetical protein DXG03_004013 [Asterophora parasitica]